MQPGDAHNVRGQDLIQATRTGRRVKRTVEERTVEERSSSPAHHNGGVARRVAS
jgi:hypothetical protein